MRKTNPMNTALRSVVIAAILLSLTCMSAIAYPEGDFHLWNTDAEDVSLMKNAKLTFEQEFRYWNDASELYYQHYDFGLVLSLAKYLDLGLVYRQIYERRKAHSKFLPEECPYVNATIKLDLWGFPLEDRNQFEFRFYDFQGNNYRYRNKVTLRTPWKFTPLNLSPYVANEIFVRIDDSMIFNQNRLSTGLTMDLWKNIKGEVYYMRQSVRGSVKWVDANVLGLKAKISF